MTSATQTADNRTAVRLPCRIAVAKGGETASIGTITDISLEGIFVATPHPMQVGAVLPLCITLSDQTLRPTAEVAHVNRAGMGLRFTDIGKQDMRRLRRYVADLANLVSNRQAAQVLSKSALGAAKPFEDSDKIRALLTDTIGKVFFTIIPQSQSVRERLKLSSVQADRLFFLTERETPMQVGETVFGLYTFDYSSFSFESTVVAITANALEISIPTMLSYSERRTSQREHASGASLHVALPWKSGEVAQWKIHERTALGMSFLVHPGEAYFWPGQQLPSAFVVTPTAKEPIDGATIKHLSDYVSEDGERWVRVGLSTAVEHAPLTTESLAHEEHKSGGRARKWGRDLATKFTYVFYKAMQRAGPSMGDGRPTVVQFNNTRDQRLVGLLSMPSSEDKKPKMPLVVVAPGFGARKETMSALAVTVVETMRRHHKDIAVLRFDGSNAIGESYKDAGCELDGREHLRYCVSGSVSDILGAVRWAKSNPFMDATEVILVSVSFSSIAVRHALTLPELAHIRQWICFMGAPDAQNAIMNIGGNVDAYALHLAGQKLGTPSLLGCLVDGDHVCADMHALRVATLEDARREMAQIKADITWYVGKNDAFMDIRRVRECMAVKATGKRQVVEVNAGHVPQSSAEALSEFALIARQIYRGLYRGDIDPYVPPLGKVGAVHTWEWARVRKSNIGSQQDYWKSYLLGGETGLGYDIWCLTPEYSQLLRDTAAQTVVTTRDVLDLGAGTGNLSAKLLEHGPKSLTSLDIVPEALERLRQKVPASDRIRCVEASADGSPRVAMRRWLAGELTDFAALVETFPADLHEPLNLVTSSYDARIHAYLRGADLNPAKHLGVNSATAHTLRGLRTLLDNAAGRISDADAQQNLDAQFAAVLKTSPGLPFASESFDVVYSSLVFSYLQRVDDALFEVHRILRPGGVFVASTLMPDIDTSKAFMNAIRLYEDPTTVVPDGHDRQTVLQAMREFIDRGAELLRLEEEGLFHFWTAEAFGDLLRAAGFDAVTTTTSLGSPAQAAIAVGTKRK